MPTIVDVLTASKFVSSDSLAEFRKWGLVEEVDDKETPVVDAAPEVSDVLRQIDEVIQGEGYVLARETDLDALRVFASGRETGARAGSTCAASASTKCGGGRGRAAKRSGGTCGDDWRSAPVRDLKRISVSK
jgi:hypothetical protein